MKPGRELDALVAEKVMGITVVRGLHADACMIQDALDRGGVLEWRETVAPWQEIRPYSTDIAAAWEVVEKIRDKGPGRFQIVFEDKVFRADEESDVWGCGWESCGTWRFEAFEKTAPHAICLAALKAIGVDLKNG